MEKLLELFDGREYITLETVVEGLSITEGEAMRYLLMNVLSGRLDQHRVAPVATYRLTESV